jgi:AcrR family transcriptional regulator
VPRAGLSLSAVVDTALAIVDEGDEPALAAIAARSGVATPSLYNHVRNLADLRSQIALRVLGEITNRIAAAVMGRSGDDAVAGLLAAWRRYAIDYPHRYAFIPPLPLNDPVLAETGTRLMEAILAVLRGYDLTGADAIHAARRLRAAAHGFIVLEIAGGFEFAADLDASYQSLIAMVTASLRKR